MCLCVWIHVFEFVCVHACVGACLCAVPVRRACVSVPMTASCRQCVRARVRACEHACVLLSVSWRDAISVPAVVVPCMIICFFWSFLGGPFGGPNPATKVRSLTVSERTFGAKFGPCSGPLFLTAFGCCLVPRGAARDRSRKQCLLEKKQGILRGKAWAITGAHAATSGLQAFCTELIMQLSLSPLPIHCHTPRVAVRRSVPSGWSRLDAVARMLRFHHGSVVASCIQH